MRSRRGTGIRWRTLPHPTTMTQDMTQVLRASKHLCQVMDNDDYSPDWQMQFYVPPMPAPDRCSASSDSVS
ncbi:hypothetical protein GmHk_19G055190 [Glycine max]|nr:hypothetical protein GmHk_19G055190 [Glycine max]